MLQQAAEACPLATYPVRRERVSPPLERVPADLTTNGQNMATQVLGKVTIPKGQKINGPHVAKRGPVGSRIEGPRRLMLRQ